MGMEFSNNQAPSNIERREKMPSAEEEKTARAIIASAKNDFDNARFSSTTRLNMAAQKLGYENYFTDPRLINVRPIISKRAAQARKRYKEINEGQDIPISREEIWMNEVMQHNDMRHFYSKDIPNLIDEYVELPEPKAVEPHQKDLF